MIVTVSLKNSADKDNYRFITPALRAKTGDTVRKFIIPAILLCSFMPVLASGQRGSGKFQIFGGYTLQRSYGELNAFSFTSGGSNNDPFTPFNSNGGQVAVSFFPLHHFGITYQIAFTGTGNRSIESSSDTQRIGTQSHLFGPTYRFAIKGARTSLFAQQLFGFSHNSFQSSNTDFAFCESTAGPNTNCSANVFTMASGGGVDFKITHHISVRPAQLEYWNESIPVAAFGGSFFGSDSFKFGINGLRYSAGGVVNF